jgi:hypothetical protein
VAKREILRLTLCLLTAALLLSMTLSFHGCDPVGCWPGDWNYVDTRRARVISLELPDTLTSDSQLGVTCTIWAVDEPYERFTWGDVTQGSGGAELTALVKKYEYSAPSGCNGRNICSVSGPVEVEFSVRRELNPPFKEGPYVITVYHASQPALVGTVRIVGPRLRQFATRPN